MSSNNEDTIELASLYLSLFIKGAIDNVLFSFSRVIWLRRMHVLLQSISLIGRSSLK